MSSQPKPYLTPEQYLEKERKAEAKSEYYQGGMFAMSGASLAHVRICMDVSTALNIQLKGSKCEVLGSDMRLKVTHTGLFTYPDVTVCEEPRLLDNQLDTLLNPVVLIEVLSPSTERYDRMRKFDHYRTIEALREYLLIASDEPALDLFTRDPSGQWLFSSARGIADSIGIPTLQIRLALSDVYQRVKFDESSNLHS